MAAYVEKSEQRYTNENGMRTIHIGEVTVTADRIIRNKTSYYHTSAVRVMITQEQIDEERDGTRIFDYLKMTGRLGRYDLTLFNGRPTIFDFIAPLKLHDVKQIDLIAPKTSTFYPNGIIAVYMKEDGKLHFGRSDYIKKAEPLGYQKRVEFYSPRYDTEEAIKNRMPDLRTTIHWQPDIQVDNNGIAYFNFYTADSETSYSVIIEGVTSNGKIIHKEGRIDKVSDNYKTADIDKNRSFQRELIPASRDTASNTIINSPDIQKDNTTILYENAKSYLNAANEHAAIYSGREEPNLLKIWANHPYLDTDTFRTGTLSVDGSVYHEIPMRLNKYSGELIVATPDERLPVVVPREYLDYAIIDSLYIVYQKPVLANGKALPEGYYIRIQDGQSQVWKHCVSSLTSGIRRVERTLDYFFEHKESFYIYSDGAYHHVKNERSLLKVFEPKKNELKKVIRDLGLSFSKSPDNIVVTITKCYNELNK